MNVHKLYENGNGEGLFAVGFDDESMADSFSDKLASKQVEPDSDGASTPHADGPERVSEEAGPVVRASQYMTWPGVVGLEAMAKTNFELSKSINRQVDEVFRNDFPIVKPASDDAGPMQKVRVEEEFRNVNDSGQTLHSLLKQAMMDHARTGVGMLVVRKEYVTMDGEVVETRTKELVRGDPKKVRPVTDCNNNPGGLWACPIHRDCVTDSDGVCPSCGVDMKEVTYARTEGVRSDTIEQPFFDGEIIDWAFYNTMLHGRDGLPPTAGVWKQASILESMRNFVGQYFDDDSGDKYPNKLLFVTTDNADSFEKQASEAKDSAQDSAYEQGIMFFENTELDVQEVDMMNDTLLGQNSEIRKQYKSDIRNAFGIPDLVDGDNEEGGLARGSKQMDVLSRTIQSMQTDLEREVLPEIEKAFGVDQYELTFEDEVEDDEKVGIDDKAEAIKSLTEAGQAYRIENGEIVLVDSDDELDEESDQTENDTTGVEE